MRFVEATTDRVVVECPAKLNLVLDVLAKRDDGYHEIESVFQSIDLCDKLAVERVRGAGVALAVEGRECPAGHDNLVVRAAEAYFAKAGWRAALRVHLVKRIPLGAGLGGGSSDAAAMLAALDRLHVAERGASLGADALASLAAGLGSDVPFFLSGGTAVCRGRGERVEPLRSKRLPDFTYVVVYPGEQVPTAKVYARFRFRLNRRSGAVNHFLVMLERTPERLTEAFTNALEEPLRECFPHLARLQDRVCAETGRRFMVTGSGSAMFAAAATRAEGLELERHLSGLAAGETFVCRSMDSAC